MSEDNPYRPPQSEIGVAERVHTRLATRNERLAAAWIDGLVFVGGALLGLYFTGMHREQIDGLLSNPFLVMFASGACASIALSLRPLRSHGQTFAQQIAGIKVVKTDGSKPTLGCVLGKRIVLFWVVLLIPVFGLAIWLLDKFLIFAPPCKCLHDYVADTIVLKSYISPDP